MISELFPSAGTRPSKRRRRTSSVEQPVSWESQLQDLLQKAPMSSTLDIVIALCPNFWDQSVSDRTKLWQEISATLSHMLAQDLISVAVDQVQVTHWSLEPNGHGDLLPAASISRVAEGVLA